FLARPTPALLNAYQAFTPLPLGEGGYQKRNTLPSPPCWGRGDGGEGIAPVVYDLGISTFLEQSRQNEDRAATVRKRLGQSAGSTPPSRSGLGFLLFSEESQE